MCDKLETIIDDLSSDEILSLFEKSLEMGEASWMLQADVFRVVSAKTKYGDKMVESIAKRFNIKRSYAFDLKNVSKEFLTKDRSTRKLPNIGKTHFIVALRNKNYVDDPIEFLKKASDNSWSTVDLKKAMVGKKVEKTHTTEYFKLEKKKIDSDKEWAKMERISDRVWIHTDRAGDKYLQLKTYD